MDWPATVGLLTLLLFSWRAFRSMRSRFRVRREKQLALQLARLIKEKCQLLEKVSQLQEEHEALEAALKEARLKEEAREAQRREAASKVSRDRAKIRGQIPFLLQELKQQQSERFQQQQSRAAEISNSIRGLAEESASLASEIAEAKAALLNSRKERLAGATTEAPSDNAHFQESHSQLSQEAQGGKEQVGELTSQKTAPQDSQARAQQLLRETGKQLKAPAERLLGTTKGWASGLPEDTTQTDNSPQEGKTPLARGPGLGHQPKAPLEKLVYGARLHASLKTMEEQRNQLRTQLSEAEKNQKQLAASLQHLQTQRASLRAANSQLRRERQKLQQKLTVRAEVHHQTLLSCHQKQREQARAREEQQQKWSKLREADHVAQELDTYRKRAQDMEEEWESTLRFHQRQVSSQQREARENWAAAAKAERDLRDLRRENARTRQLLRALEMKAPLSVQDAATLSGMRSASARGHPQPGPSRRRRGGPASARRCFHPLPTLWEEPLGSSASCPAGPGSPAKGSQMGLIQLRQPQAKPRDRA